MAKPVKKENEEIILQHQGLIIPEDLQYPGNLDNPEVFISQLQKLEEAKAVLDKMQGKAEDGILDFLYNKFISKYPGGVMAMLAINYNWSERLLDAHSDFLKQYLLDENYMLFRSGYANINYKKGVIASKIDPICLRKKYGEFNVFDRATKKTTSYWGNLFCGNPYWTIDTINLYKDKMTDWAEHLSSNNKINWNKELLKTFEKDWAYGELLGNWSLPWSDELLEFISEIYEESFEDAVFTDDYDLENLVANMNSGFNLWDRISNDRYSQNWSMDFMDKNKEMLNWKLLSDNPSLPFTLDFFNRFEKNWDMGNGTTGFGVWENPSLFDKVFAPLLNDSIVEKIIKRYY